MRFPKTQQRSCTGGTDIMSVVMTVVQILGWAVTAVALKQFTPLPFWACFVLAIPLFLFLLWGALMLLSKGRNRDNR
jgi:hypothetical protein